MKLTVQIKLLPGIGQAKALRETLETANRAANRLSQLAWDKKEFRQFPLHNAFYKTIRAEFPLSAQIVVRLNAKVTDAYKLDQKKQRVFRKQGSICYDSRILSFNLPKSTVSIWTLGGRETIPFVCGERARKLLELPRGEADLILRDGKWFLNVTVDVPEEREKEATGWLGIDLGLATVAKSSDGQTFGEAKKIAGIRDRRFRQRRRLQAKRTRSTLRVLRNLRGREARFVRHENHCISRQIVDVAKCTGRGVSLEDLSGIRSRIKARKAQRRILHSWAFRDLADKIAYKCRLAGVPCKFVDPRNTSRTCASCGFVSKKNRPARDKFVCQSCGQTADADHNAARNIAGLGVVIRPDERDGVKAHVQNPPFMVG